MSSTKLLQFSDSFAISCGTVTIDPKESKVLLILLRRTGEYVLPKGRKDIGETLEQTALRETYEETGFHVQLLPLRIPTLATSPRHAAAVEGGEASSATTEPIAVTQRQTRSGVLKIIFWFAATGDSTAPKIEDTCEDDEDFETAWTPIPKVLSILSFDDDREVTAKVLQAAVRLL